MKIFDELKKRYGQRYNEAKAAVNFVRNIPNIDTGGGIRVRDIARQMPKTFVPSVQQTFSRQGLGSLGGAREVAKGVTRSALNMGNQLYSISPNGLLTKKFAPKTEQINQNFVRSLNKRLAPRGTETQKALNEGFKFSADMAPYSAIEGGVIQAGSKILPKVAASKVGQFGLRRAADVASGQLLTPKDQMPGGSRLKQAGMDIVGGTLMEGAGRVVSPVAKTADNKIRTNKVANKMDAPIPDKYNYHLNENGEKLGKRYTPDTKVVEMSNADFEKQITGNSIKVNRMNEKGKTLAHFDKNTGDLITWSTDNPLFAKRIQENKLTFGLSTREVRPSESPLSNEARKPIVYKNQWTKGKDYGDTLYHETSPQDAMRLSGMRDTVSPSIYVANSEELAQGQGGKGIKIMFDPEKSLVRQIPLDKQKPGAGFLHQQGLTDELNLTPNRAEQGWIKGVIVKKGTPDINQPGGLVKSFFTNTGLDPEKYKILPNGDKVYDQFKVTQPLSTTPKTGAKQKNPIGIPTQKQSVSKESIQSKTPIESNPVVEGKTAVSSSDNIPQNTQNVNVTKERSFTQRVRGNDKVDAKVKEKLDGLYNVRNTQELAQKAKNLVNDYPETAYQVYKESNDDKGIAVGFELMGKAAREKNNALEAEIANELAERLTKSGQTSQAAAIYGRLTPEGIVRFAASEINKANKANPKLNLSLTPEDSVRLREMAMQVKKIADPEKKAMATQKLMEEISSLVPTPLTRKLTTLWKAGLLTGLKTTGVNTMGNAAHSVMEVVKDAPATVVDAVASLFTGKRTKTLTLKGTGGGVKEGFEKGWRYLRTGYDERNIAAKFDYQKVNFGKSKFARALQGYEEGVFRLMGAEDQPFYYGAKARSLYDQAFAEAKNQGLRGEAKTKFVEKFVQSPPDKALQNAVNDAEVAVFQNSTTIGNMAQGLGKNAAGEIIAPFRRTPAAVAMEVLNYTPVGAVKAVIENVGKGRFDQRAFSQLMGKSIAGSGLLVAGSAIAAKGLMTLGYPQSEKERNQWELEGKQPNSIKIGNRWYQAGSLGPVGMTLLVGGYYQQALKETGSKTQALAAAMAGVGKSVIDQTFLQGASRAINALQDPTRYAGSYIGQTVGSVIPTFVADVSKATDKFERSTKDSIIDPLKSRVPGLRQTLSSKKDVLGREIKTQGPLRTMFDFTRSTKVRGDEAINALGETGATPTKFDKTIRLFKQDIKLDPKELDKLNQETGGMIEKAVNELVNTSGFKDLDKDDKAKVLNNTIDQVKESQKMSLVGGKLDANALNSSAKLEIEKLKFANESGRFKDLGDTVLVKDANGKITDKPKDQYKYEVAKAKRTQAKKLKNFTAYKSAAKEEYKYLAKKYNEAGDELTKIEAMNDINTLLGEYIKYNAYKGFSKAKKAKRKKLSLATPSIKPPSISRASTSVNITAPTLKKLNLGGSTNVGRPKSLKTKRYAS